MEKIILLYIAILSLIPGASIIEKYINIDKVNSLDDQVHSMQTLMYEYKSNISTYISNDEYKDLKPGVYDVSKDKTLLENYGIYDDHVEILRKDSPLSMSYAAKTYVEMVDELDKSINESLSIVNASLNLMLNITQTYGNETIESMNITNVTFVIGNYTIVVQGYSN